MQAYFTCSSQRLTLQPPSPDRFEGWRTTLGADEIEAIEAVAGPTLLELGYRPAGSLPDARRMGRAYQFGGLLSGAFGAE